MRLGELIDMAKKMQVGEEVRVYSLEGVDFILRRPEKSGRSLKREYKPETNLQIWIKEKCKDEFMPNHLRILLDLEFKMLFRPEYKEDLLLIFDELFYGEDPDVLYEEVKDLQYPKELRDLRYDLYLTQLFFVEQAVSYSFKSRFDPKYLYLQGWIRCLLMREMEIDKLLWSAMRNPPPVKFTKKDNRMHREYDPNVGPLWYTTEV